MYRDTYYLINDKKSSYSVFWFLFFDEIKILYKECPEKKSLDHFSSLLNTLLRGHSVNINGFVFELLLINIKR